MQIYLQSCESIDNFLFAVRGYVKIVEILLMILLHLLDLHRRHIKLRLISPISYLARSSSDSPLVRNRVINHQVILFYRLAILANQVHEVAEVIGYLVEQLFGFESVGDQPLLCFLDLLDL